MNFGNWEKEYSSDGYTQPASTNQQSHHDNHKTDSSLDSDTMFPKGVRVRADPPTLLQLVLLNALVCGSEIVLSAGFAYLPPMLLKAGVREQHMCVFLSLGPLLACFIVPHIARASDNCRSRFGRRRPFIFVLGLLTCLSLLIIPYGENVTSSIFQKNYWWIKYTGIFLLGLGTVLLDFSAQACLTPCEALLTDVSRASGTSERTFMVYSFMSAVGGCVGYLITALDWNSSPLAVLFGGQEKTCFTVLFFLFLLAMFASLGVAQEALIDNVEIPIHDTDATSLTTTDIADLIKSGGNTKYDLGYESLSNHSDEGEASMEKRPLKATDRTDVNSPRHINVQISKPYLYLPSILSADRSGVHLHHRLLKRFSYLLKYLTSGIYQKLPWAIQNICEAPGVLKKLMMADFFSWSAIMCFNLYFSDFVGQYVYDGDPNSVEGSKAQIAYDNGVRNASWGLLLHCVLAALCSVFMETLVDRFGSKWTFLSGMVSFTIALTVMVFSKNFFMVMFLATLTGFSNTVVTTIPFSLITMYQDDKEVFFYDIDYSTRGTAQDISILDSSYYLSQVILTMIVGYVAHLCGTVAAYMVCSALFGIVACYCVTQVPYSRQEMITSLRNRRQQMISKATENGTANTPVM
ncbi:solute carrier family 45 member 3-like [Lineus longissimus]|uniref:solute carrier family 45 member 3-like n=1 Tax=Lineus longissimus TaxID=88925 RepID=UPI002B4E6FBF